MEIREGYKKTKIGWIPEDWKAVELGSIAEIVNRKNFNGYEFPVLSISAKKGFENQKDKFKKGIIAGSSLKKYTLIHRNEFSYNKGNSKTYPHGCIFRLKTYEKALIPFVYITFSLKQTCSKSFYSNLLSDKYRLSQLRKFISSGARQDGLLNISKDDFFKLLIPFPPLPEQKKIAAILSTVDEKIESIDSQIKQTEQLKKGLMNKLLTEGIGHTEFKDTKIGRIPKSWDVVKLDQVFNLKSGSFLSKNSIIEGKYPVYGGNGITAFHNQFSFDEPKIVIGRVGAKCGCVYITEPFSWITDNALYVNEIKLDYDVKFLSYQLHKLNLNDLANKNAQPVISGKKIYAINIPLIRVGEQRKIAEIIGTVDNKIILLKEKKSKYQTLKKGLMQQLLTGQTRVKI